MKSSPWSSNQEKEKSLKKYLKTLWLIPALLLAVFATSAFANAPTAHAASISKSNVSHALVRVSHPILAPQVGAAMSPSGCSLQVQGPWISEQGPVASVSGYNGTGGNSTLHMGLTRTISNTLSATIGFSVSYISASVGYSVTASQSVALDYTITVPSHQTGYIDAYADFYEWLLTNSCTHAQAVADVFDGNIAFNGYTQ